MLFLYPELVGKYMAVQLDKSTARISNAFIVLFFANIRNWRKKCKYIVRGKTPPKKHPRAAPVGKCFLVGDVSQILRREK